MDPVTGAIIAAVARLGEQVVFDAYAGLKSLIRSKFGNDSSVSKSLDDLEAEPESKGRQIVLEEQLAKSGAGTDDAVLQAADNLRKVIEAQGAGNTVITQQAGDGAVQFGSVSGGSINIER